MISARYNMDFLNEFWSDEKAQEPIFLRNYWQALGHALALAARLQGDDNIQIEISQDELLDHNRPWLIGRYGRGWVQVFDGQVKHLKRIISDSREELARGVYTNIRQFIKDMMAPWVKQQLDLKT